MFDAPVCGGSATKLLKRCKCAERECARERRNGALFPILTELGVHIACENLQLNCLGWLLLWQFLYHLEVAFVFLDTKARDEVIFFLFDTSISQIKHLCQCVKNHIVCRATQLNWKLILDPLYGLPIRDKFLGIRVTATNLVDNLEFDWQVWAFPIIILLARHINALLIVFVAMRLRVLYFPRHWAGHRPFLLFVFSVFHNQLFRKIFNLVPLHFRHFLKFSLGLLSFGLLFFDLFLLVDLKKQLSSFFLQCHDLVFRSHHRDFQDLFTILKDVHIDPMIFEYAIKLLDSFKFNGVNVCF